MATESLYDCVVEDEVTETLLGFDDQLRIKVFTAVCHVCLFFSNQIRQMKNRLNSISSEEDVQSFTVSSHDSKAGENQEMLFSAIGIPKNTKQAFDHLLLLHWIVFHTHGLSILFKEDQ